MGTAQLSKILQLAVKKKKKSVMALL